MADCPHKRKPSWAMGKSISHCLKTYLVVIGKVRTKVLDGLFPCVQQVFLSAIYGL